MAGFVDVARNKLVGILSDVSSSTSDATARADSVETVAQMVSVPLTFSLATSTAAAEKSSLRLPVPENANWTVRKASFVLESGSLAAGGLTDYLTITVNKSANGTSTKVAVAAWNSTTDTCALGTNKNMTVTGANKLLTGGSLIVDLTKTGAGQTTGVANVTVVLARRSD